MQRLGGPVLRRIVGVPLPSDEVYESAERLLERLRYVHDLLANPDQASVRLVLNLERVSIQEAQRSFTYFHLYGYPTDMIIANRVLPVASGAYFDAWREAQARYLPLVEQQFAPVPVRTIPYFDQGDGRPWRVWPSWAAPSSVTPTRRSSCTAAGPTRSTREDLATSLSVELPFASREEITLSRSADELVLQVGTWRRNLVLPRLLLDAPTEGAKMEDRVLKVRFAEPPRGPAGGRAMDDSRLDRLERRMDELDQRSSATERALERALERSRRR